MNGYVIPLNRLGRHDVETVGGKNSSLGEMLQALSGLGIQVPGGFATTAGAYRDFLKQGELGTRIHARLATLDIDDVVQLARTGAAIRDEIRATPLPARLRDEVLAAWRTMDEGQGIAVAVRSSATAEDLPEASFAGQQETFLNVQGEAALLTALHEVYASLYNDRAIAYRCRLACNTWCAATWAPAASCSRWIRIPVSAMRSLSPVPMASVKRWCRVR
jgi:pyruvate, water dikinase